MADLQDICNEFADNSFNYNPEELEVMDSSSGDIKPTNNIEQSKIVNIQIGPQHFDLLKLIGEGAFGKVILVRNRLDKMLYAMKVLSKKLLKKKNNVQYMKSERDILTKIQHPFVVSLYFAFQSETKLFLVMDFLAGGELFFHLRKKGIILEKEAKFYLGELILAIEFLHQKGIIHRDLKPENVLLRKDGHINITDFGLAKEIGDDVMARTLCGTSEYMAPEMLTRNGYNKAVDWWSLGALCFEMLAGKPPFSGKSQKELDRKILTEKFTAPSYLSPATHALLKGLMEKDSSKRLGCAKSSMFSIGGVSALKQHAFFEFMDWAALERLQINPPFNFFANVPAVTTATAADCDNKNELQYFDEGFTTQQISLSMLEDSLTTTGTPVRSGHNSKKQDDITSSNDINNRNNSNNCSSMLYEGFEYMSSTKEYTETQVAEFHLLLQNKIHKANKRKALKSKKEEKSAAEEAKRAAAVIVAAQQLKEQQQLEADLLAKKLAAEESQRAYQRELLRVREFNKLVVVYTEDVHACQKRLKVLRKKQRDILDLQEKIASSVSSGSNNSNSSTKPSKEQQVKLDRLPQITSELTAVADEERLLLTRLTAHGEQLLTEPLAPNTVNDGNTVNNSSSSSHVEKESKKEGKHLITTTNPTTIVTSPPPTTTAAATTVVTLNSEIDLTVRTAEIADKSTTTAAVGGTATVSMASSLASPSSIVAPPPSVTKSGVPSASPAWSSIARKTETSTSSSTFKNNNTRAPAAAVPSLTSNIASFRNNYNSNSTSNNTMGNGYPAVGVSGPVRIVAPVSTAASAAYKPSHLHTSNNSSNSSSGTTSINDSNWRVRVAVVGTKELKQSSHTNSSGSSNIIPASIPVVDQTSTVVANNATNTTNTWSRLVTGKSNSLSGTNNTAATNSLPSQASLLENKNVTTKIQSNNAWNSSCGSKKDNYIAAS